jgi:hypothetical protein
MIGLEPIGGGAHVEKLDLEERNYKYTEDLGVDIQ